VYERGSGRLLGAQGFGPEGVDKRLDVLATALQARMTVADLAELDLAYAPPYSSANDPINLAAFVAGNDLSGFGPLVTAAAALAELAGPRPPVVLDVRTEKEFSLGHLEGAVNIPVDELRARLGELPATGRLLVHCKGGFRAHLAVRTLLGSGRLDLANITGGWTSLQLEAAFRPGGASSPGR
jgi:rhodanese-related sulfurtransferase